MALETKCLAQNDTELKTHDQHTVRFSPAWTEKELGFITLFTL